MKNSTKFTKATLINAGNFQVSIGTFSSSEIAIISKSSGNFVNLEQIKTSKRLRKVKRLLKSNINSDSTFTFSFMQDDQIDKLIQILKGN